MGDERGQQHCKRCSGEAVCSAGSAPAAPRPAPHTASCPTATSELHRMAGGGGKGGIGAPEGADASKFGYPREVLKVQLCVQGVLPQRLGTP